MTERTPLQEAMRRFFHRRFGDSFGLRGFIVHRWVEHEGNSAKRRCSLCGRVEWLFSRPFPSSTEPSLVWKRMHYEEAEYLDSLSTHLKGDGDG